MQNKAKKLMLPLIAVMMMLWMPAGISVTAYAAEPGDGPTVYVSDAQGNVGDIVEVNIGISNNPGIVAARLTANYNTSALRLNSVTDKGLFGTSTLRDQLTSPFIMIWDDSSSSGNFTGNGDQITLQFEILSDSGSGVTVTYNEKPEDIDIINFDLDPVYFDVINGSVSVSEPTYGIAHNVVSPYEFQPAIQGYTAPSPLSVTITNTGSLATGDLTVDITFLDGSPAAFALNTVSLAGIAAGGNAGFTVAPIVGLNAGTYSALVTVGPASGDLVNTVSFIVNFTVNAVALESIAVTTPPTKAVYFAGETLDLAGMVVTATYNDGDSAQVTGYSTTLATGDVLNTVGPQLITVNYQGKTTTFTVTVNPVVLESISVTTLPTTTEYFAGEILDLTGMVVTAAYNNNTTAEITGYSTSPAAGAALNNIGPQLITVNYQGETDTFTVTVNAVVVVVLESISVTTLPTKTVYFEGETLNLAGMIVTATYSNGDSDTVTGYNTTLSTGDALNNVGPQLITVTFQGVTTTLTVTVNPVVLESISVTTPPTKTVYFAGETLDLAGMVVTAEYNNNSTAEVTGYSTSPAAGDALNTIGSQLITVTYQGETTDFTVTVNEVVLESISVTTPPTKTEYFAGEILDLTGMVVTAEYSDGNSAQVTGYGTTPAAGDALNTVGSQPVTVSYTEGEVTKTNSFVVTVRSIPEKSIVVTGVNPEFQIGLAIQETGEMIYEPEFSDTNEVVFVVTGMEGPFMLWIGIEDYYPEIVVEDINADETYDISNYFYEVEVPEGVSGVGISLIDDVWYVNDIGEGIKINLLKTNAEAVLVFNYNGSLYEETFILDGSNPFSEFGAEPVLEIRFEVVRTVRAGLTLYDYEVSAFAVNNGGVDATGVRAVIVDYPENVSVVINGELYFGNVQAGGTEVGCSDTFTVRVDRTTAFDESQLKFEFYYDLE